MSSILRLALLVLIVTGCRPLAPSGGEVVIPDGTEVGITLGPLTAGASAGRIESVLLCVEIRHDYAADLDLTLSYDADGDGEPEATSPVELYLARPGSPASPIRFAYPTMLHEVLYFRDQTEAERLQMGPISNRCVVDGVDLFAARPFEAFRGLNGGGDFSLSVMDTVACRRGAILDWAVTVRTVPDRSR